MKKFFYYTAVIFSLSLILGSCTTAMDSQPSSLKTHNNRYEFFIETGGFSGAKQADQRLSKEAVNFMTLNNYKSYKVVDRTDQFIPSGFKYIIQFSR